MAVRNNSFSKDDDSDRAERLELLSANIDTYAVELGYGGARLTWAQGADAAPCLNDRYHSTALFGAR